MEERVVGGVAGATLLEDLEGLVEGEPLGEAEVELVGVLELFESEEVFPVGVVLDACDTVGEGVFDGQVEGFGALFGAGWRNFAEDQVGSGGFAEDSGGVAGGVAIDFGAGGVGGVGCDAGGGEGGGVGEGDVTVYPLEDAGVALGDRVDVLPGGEFGSGPESVIPASAFQPDAGFGFGGVDADPLLHLGKGFDSVEVDGELLVSGGGHVGVGVVESGHCEGVVEVDDAGLRDFELEHFGVGAGGEDLSVGDGQSLDLSGGGGGVVGAKVGAGEDVAVEVDGVGRGLLRGREGGEEESCGESEGFHEWSVSRSWPCWVMKCSGFRSENPPPPLRGILQGSRFNS